MFNTFKEQSDMLISNAPKSLYHEARKNMVFGEIKQFSRDYADYPNMTIRAVDKYIEEQKTLNKQIEADNEALTYQIRDVVAEMQKSYLNRFVALVEEHTDLQEQVKLPVEKYLLKQSDIYSNENMKKVLRTYQYHVNHLLKLMKQINTFEYHLDFDIRIDSFFDGENAKLKKPESSEDIFVPKNIQDLVDFDDKYKDFTYNELVDEVKRIKKNKLDIRTNRNKFIRLEKEKRKFIINNLYTEFTDFFNCYNLTFSMFEQLLGKDDLNRYLDDFETKESRLNYDFKVAVKNKLADIIRDFRNLVPNE